MTVTMKRTKTRKQSGGTGHPWGFQTFLGDRWVHKHEDREEDETDEEDPVKGIMKRY